MDSEKFHTEVLQRLDALVAIQLEQIDPTKHVPTVKKIETLRDAGLRPAAIGMILGKPTNYVTSALSQLSKRTRKSSADSSHPPGTAGVNDH